MNYFVINRPSNLIIKVVASRYAPEDTNLHKFIQASDKALDTYYKWVKANPEMLLDIGDLMSRSATVMDAVSAARAGQAKPKRLRYRNEEQPAVMDDRMIEIRSWLRFNPTADEYNLDERFGTGIVAARAYIKNLR